jgi:serine/threonine protein kinase
MSDQPIAPTGKTFGPYSSLRTLGASNNNAVYMALHQGTGRLVALRALTVNHDNREQALEACKTEVARFAAYSIPNVVQIEDYGIEGSTLYIAMRVMKGGSLQDRLKAVQRKVDAGSAPILPSPGEVVAVVERLAQALDGLHGHGMVHGQVEPRNILFDDSGLSYMSDVGLTRLLKIIYSLETTNSFSTTKYTAPELWDGKRPSPATDQYALACIAYELMTGKAPFEAPTIYGLMRQHTDEVALPPHYIRRGLPADLAIPFWQAMAKLPEKRFPNLRAFLDDLRTTIQGNEGTATGFFALDL